MGTPRTVSPCDEELIKMGEEMVEWVRQNDPLHLSEWYTIEKMYTYNQWKTFIQREAFIPYYEISLKLVGRKYLDRNSDVREGVSQRWQRVYFKDLKEEEDETLAYKAELSRKQKDEEDSQDSMAKKIVEAIAAVGRKEPEGS